MRHLSRVVGVSALALLVALTVACGGSTNPASPSGASPASASGAVIQGTVLGGAASARSADTTGGSMTVTVVGTNITATVTLTGQFTLNGVPSGDIQLKFHGNSGDAILQLLQLAQGQTLTITVTVTGTTATEETEVRSDPTGTTQVEGRIDSINTAASTFTVAGKTIVTNSSTVLRHGNTPYTFADLQVGWRVHVAGTPGSGGVVANTIEVQNVKADIQVNVNGIVQAMQGTSTAFQFTVGGTTVKGDGATAFSGKNGFSSLVNGARVEVKGQQMNGYVYATSIHVN